MLKGKELLLEIINNTLLAEGTTTDLQQLAFDTTELNAFLTNFKNPSQDIIYLTDEMLNNLICYIEPEEDQKTFSASIKYIRGLILLNKENETSIPLNEDQILKLTELTELIKIVIEKNNYLTKHLKERSEKQISEYRRILSTILNEQIFTSNDYDTVEQIVKNETPKNIESNLDIIYTFMNEFNSRKLNNIMLGKKENSSIEKNELEIKLPSKDIFDSAITSSNNSNAEKTKRIIELIKYLGYDYNELEINFKLKLIGLKDIDGLEQFVKYIKDNKPEIYNSIKKDNIYGVIYLLINSNISIFEKVTNVLQELDINLMSTEFKKIINTGTTIFTENGLNNFKLVIDLLSPYKISYRYIIRDHISLFTTNYEKVERIINMLEKKGTKLELLFEKCPLLITSILKNELSLVEKNLNILEMYGFNIEDFLTEELPAFSLLNSDDLAIKIDQFIEVGLNDFIHKDSHKAGTALKNLTIKKIYYAYKNNYQVWSNNSIESSEKDYKKIIDNSPLIMSDTEIENIKLLYPVMEIIDEGYRAAIYTDAPMGLLKRKTEFVFGTQIISRPKVFKIFKILVEEEMPQKEALFNAITYNSILEPHEHEFITEAVSKIGEDVNYDRLLKTN